MASLITARAAFAVFVAIVGTTTGTTANAQPRPMRMVIANGVVCRQQPNSSSPAIASYQLGDIEPPRAQVNTAGEVWYQFMPRRVGCWIHSSLTTDATDRHAALLAATDRILSRTDAVPLEDYVAIDNLLRRTSTHAHSDSTILDTSPVLQLRRYQLLDRAGQAEASYTIRRDPLKAAWFFTYRDTLRYHEPGGQWMVTADMFWSLYERHANTRWAEEIAWSAARGSVPSDECDAFCQLEALRRTYVRYLIVFPRGRWAAEALQQAEQRIAVAAQVGCVYTDAAATRQLVSRLRASLAPLPEAARNSLSAQLANVERVCQGLSAE